MALNSRSTRRSSATRIFSTSPVGDGSNQDDGCYILLKEVVDNTIDEFIMGHGKEVQIKVEGTRVSVRDYGRGIPLGKVIECVSQINTGAKYIRARPRTEKGRMRVSRAGILQAAELNLDSPRAFLPASVNLPILVTPVRNSVT